MKPFLRLAAMMAVLSPVACAMLVGGEPTSPKRTRQAPSATSSDESEDESVTTTTGATPTATATTATTTAKAQTTSAPRTIDTSWPASRGRALVDPGPPEPDWGDRSGARIGEGPPKKCTSDGDCNWAGEWGNICTPSGICLCDASKNISRCGHEGNLKCANLLTSTSNCGKCGVVCPDGRDCVRGQCQAVHCAAGETLCGIGCQNLRDSNFNCGGCGHKCADGFSCLSGKCVR